MSIRLGFGSICCLALSTWSCGGTPSLQSTNTYEPASFTGKRHSLQRLVRFPKVKGEISVRLYCEGEVSMRGVFTSNYCTSTHERAAPFQWAIGNAIQGAKIRPARVDGMEVSAYIQYRLEFERSRGQTTIQVFPNHGYYREKYGDNYSSAQSYRMGRWRGCSHGVRHVVEVDVGLDGLARNARIAGGSESSAGCEQMTMGLIQGRRFIPAHVDGQPFASRYAEVFLSGDQMRANSWPIAEGSATREQR